jgi:hypothetical protein
MDWTSGHVAACLKKYAIVTEITIADGDAASPRGPVSSERAVQHIPHGVHPSKELRMNAHVSDEGRVPAVGRLNQGGKPPSQKSKAPAKVASATWLIAGLLVLSVVPLASGAFRLTQLTGGAEVTPANARFFASPLPVVLHIVDTVTLTSQSVIVFEKIRKEGEIGARPACYAASCAPVTSFQASNRCARSCR